MPHVLATGKWPYLDQSLPKDADGGPNVGWAYEAALKTSYGDGWQGTSLAAPNANGIAACVISANPSAFRSWPEKTRLALILTAQNCEGGEWNPQVGDGKDGTGAISGNDAAIFAAEHIAVFPNNTEVITGLSAGSWYSTDINPKYFNITVPTTKPAGKHLRVVLTWDSRPDLLNSENYLSDFDIVCQGYGSIGSFFVKSSVSVEGNVEVIDIPRSSLTSIKKLFVTINPTVLRFPANEELNYVCGVST